MHTKGLQITTPTDSTIVLTRTFNAPLRLVWEAMLWTEQFRRNWEARFEVLDALLDEMKSEEEDRSRRG